MSRRLLMAAFTTVALCAFLSLARAFDDKEPDRVYRGKTAKEWKEILDTDKDPMRRRAVLTVIEKFGPKERLVIPAAVGALRKDADEQVRLKAAQLLGRMVLPAAQEEIDVRDGIEALAEALGSDKKEKVREACAFALGVIGTEPKEKEKKLPAPLAKALKPTVPILAAALKDKHAGTAAAAAESLGRMGKAAREASPVLLETLKDKKADRFARGFAAIALVRIGGEDVADAVPALIEILADDKAPLGVRESAARLLGQLGKDAASAVPTLGKALSAKELEIRRAAASALAQMGENSKDVLPALEKALKDKDKTVRLNALFAIGALGKDAAHAVDVVIPCLKDNQVEIRLAAIRAVGNIGPDAKDAAKLLLDATRDGQAAVRDAAKESLKKIQGEEK
jgi:HEAT repeat protein